MQLKMQLMMQFPWHVHLAHSTMSMAKQFVKHVTLAWASSVLLAPPTFEIRAVTFLVTVRITYAFHQVAFGMISQQKARFNVIVVVEKIAIASASRGIRPNVCIVISSLKVLLVYSRMTTIELEPSMIKRVTKKRKTS